MEDDPEHNTNQPNLELILKDMDNLDFQEWIAEIS